MIRDRNIEWERKRVQIDPLVGMGWTTAGTVPVGLHTGAPVFAEIGTLGFGAVKFEGEGDEWCNLWALPADVDVDQPLYLRVVYSSGSSTAADTMTFIVTYKAFAEGEAFAAADTALNTAIAADTYGGAAANTVAKTAWGKINGAVLSEGDILLIETEIHATDATIASEFVYLVGLEVEYSPKRTAGTGNSQEATTPTS